MTHQSATEMVVSLDDSELDDLIYLAQKEYRARLDRLLVEARDRQEAEEFYKNKTSLPEQRMQL